jgi:NhaA family Na+:H+ antiporter
MLVPVEKVIHHFVNFIILPLFALANTAILIPSNFIGALKNDVALGIIFGLFVGKPVGIYLTSRVLVALKIAQLPTNVNWKQVFGMGMLAGIGFTMSIFTTMLAFSDEAIRDISKIAILTAVFFSVVCSVIYFVLTSKKVAVKRKKIEIETRSMEIRLAS